jgi:hypothetical protein
MQDARISNATASSSVAEILERVLDKGVVVAGDIRVKLVDIELLTIQIRLVVCSIDKAKEIGIDWWNFGLGQQPEAIAEETSHATDLARRLASLEEKIAQAEDAA